MSATRKWAVVGSVAAISTIGLGTAAYAAPNLNDPQPANPTATAPGTTNAAPVAASADTPGEVASTNTPGEPASANTPGDTTSANTPAGAASANTPGDTASANTPGDESADTPS
ncbi:hypothetical protein [Kribbella catacumbae]|uniref:hypothetical protein n=1 Tax=Kribbella catacumbae TaxID=460086 RepID=UPI0003673B5B|nr:hypothetical protein [Kribbella catacumbae]